MSDVVTQAELETLAAALGETLLARGERVATAESCTGGWLAQCLTAIAGSSAWFERGFVTYSNAAKEASLGVDADTLAAFGAVSEETAAAMAEGTLAHAEATFSVGITGIAGPGGATPGKPVGTVCFGFGQAGNPPITRRLVFPGDRRAVRAGAVAFALRGLLSLARGSGVPTES
jgi:nicotinamide-nucleotide amidase